MSEAAAAASGSGHPRIWSRREPRPHISSVCSVGETGETSTLADEVNEVLGRMDPNDLQDIVSDDEDADADGSQANFDETISSDGKCCGQFLYPERGQKQKFFDHLPPSSCPRSY